MSENFPEFRWRWCLGNGRDESGEKTWQDFPVEQSFNLQMARSVWVQERESRHGMTLYRAIDIQDSNGNSGTLQLADNSLTSGTTKNEAMCRVTWPSDNKMKWTKISACLEEIKGGSLKDYAGLKSVFNIMTNLNARMQTLEYFIEKQLPELGLQKQFFQLILPFLAEQALKIPKMPTLPILLSQREDSVELTTEQCCIILSGAFFCLFPLTNPVIDETTVQLPKINFLEMYLSMEAHCVQSVLAKLLHLTDYFATQANRVKSGKGFPNHRIRFTRQVLVPTEKDLYNTDWWKARHVPLVNCEIVTDRSAGAIETVFEGDGERRTVYRMDFANKFLGGGVLGSHGCVQEEIAFVEYPEFICGQLFCEVMRKNETILMEGVERFSIHTGYAFSMKYKAHFDDKTPVKDNMIQTFWVAMDAVRFYKPRSPKQFSRPLMLRELNKLYRAFDQNNKTISPSADDSKEEKEQIIATGNWGCGAFFGDHQLKAMLQIIAASACGQNLRYFTFGDQPMEGFEKVYKLLKEMNVTGAELWLLVLGYAEKITHPKNNRKITVGVFEYIFSRLMKSKQRPRQAGASV